MKHSDPRLDLSRALVLPWAAVSTKVQDRYSVEDQLRLEREWCAKHNATIVDELVVRGFSRDYWTLADVVAAAASDPNMEAFAKLQSHIRKRSFNVFLCFDADRFGRTQSLVHEIIGRITRDCGALIYTLFDGVWMDEESAPMIGTMKAYKAQADVKKLRDYRATGMENRARNGKSTSAILPIYHKRVRDESGKEIAVVVNEALRSLWTDLATLILRGVSWNQMERTLFEEFGHGVGDSPYRVSYFHDLVTSPGWWGHAALNYRQHNKQSTKGVAPWVWDISIPPPSQVTVYRNTLPAVYDGEWAELGEQVKAELWRRYKLRGKATPGNTFRFHGLLVCDTCGYTLTMTVGNAPRRQKYVRCATYYDHRYGSRSITCDQRGYMTIEAVQEFINERLEEKLAGKPSEVFDLDDKVTETARRIVEMETLAARAQRRLDVFIDELGDAEGAARNTIRAKMNQAGAEVERLNRAIDLLKGEQHLTHDVERAQRDALNIISANGGTAWFWKQPDTVIHQLLSAALGNRQLVVRDHLIKGAIPMENKTLLKRRRNT